MKQYFHQAASALRRRLTSKRFIKSAGFSAALCLICLLPLWWISHSNSDPPPSKPAQGSATKPEVPNHEVPDPKKESTHVIIYSTDHSRWVAWPTPDAIKFSLDQLVTTVRYLFAAAAVGLAFVGKIVIEPRLSSSSLPLPIAVRYALITAALFWIGSITSGMLAHLYLNTIGTSAAFALSGPVGTSLLFQILYFALALWLFVIAMVNSISADP